MTRYEELMERALELRRARETADLDPQCDFDEWCSEHEGEFTELETTAMEVLQYEMISGFQFNEIMTTAFFDYVGLIDGEDWMDAIENGSYVGYGRR